MADVAAPPAATAPSTPSILRGTVKQVLSGDAIVLQSNTRTGGGPPLEATVYLANLTAPRIAKRPTENSPGSSDEPFAWAAREWLRTKLIGQQVIFVKDFTATSSRDHGRIYLGSVESGECVNKTGVAEGWLEVRPGKVQDDYATELLALQETAKAAKKGRWSDKLEGSVRDIKWTTADPRHLVDQLKQKPVDAVIEQVRDGSTVRAFLLPSMDYVTVQLSGVRCPSVRGVSGVAEPFAEEAKFFVESRLLQQDLQIVLESVSNANFVGSIVHPKGNIAESLLREGFGKCVDWSIGLCTGGAEKLRAAESLAKERRMRIWKAYTPSAAALTEKKKFEGKVVEVVLNDALMILRDNGEETKVHLSSIRLPREAQGDRPAQARQFRPLYDIPYMYEIREFLRKKLIGKRVSVTVDYIQPKTEAFPEKTCCTVEIAGKNVAIGLLEKGYSKVVRHRQDDENRSSQYDALLTAEATAEKEQKGLFAPKVDGESHLQRIQELQGDVARSKQFLPYLQRGHSRAEGIVEFITSGSRMRIYVPKETCLLTFLLGGINCPRGARAGANGQPMGQSEPFAEEAARFTRRTCMQREVELEVEGLDKQGSFIGYLWVKTEEGGRQNLSELLLEQGLASLHFTAEKSSHYNHMATAETRAKNAKRNLWANWTDTEAVEKEEEAAAAKAERTVNYKKIVITDVQQSTPVFKFAAQLVDDGPRLESMMKDLRSALSSNPPVAGSFTPKRSELVAAKFSADGLWYRARVEGLKAGQADLLYVDFGNRETVSVDSLAALPPGLSSVPPGAKEYALALVTVPNDAEYAKFAYRALEQILFTSPKTELNVEYTAGAVQFAQVIIEAEGERTDVGRALVQDGYALSEKRREARLQKMVTELQEAEKTARKERRNIWEFGDFTGNDI